MCLLDFLLTRAQSEVIKADYDNNSKVIGYKNFCILNLSELLSTKKSFRNVYFFRLREYGMNSWLIKIGKLIYRPLDSIYVYGKFGPGLRLNHDYMTVRVDKAGNDFVVQQGVTIAGLKGDCAPRFGDDVYIGANALVLGEVNCGNHVNIGAGTLIINMNIPDNCTVVGNPPRIINREGDNRPKSFHKK